MTNVFIVIQTTYGSGYYDEADFTSVIGAYSTREKAQEAIDNYVADTKRNFPTIAHMYDYDIEEIEFVS